MARLSPTRTAERSAAYEIIQIWRDKWRIILMVLAWRNIVDTAGLENECCRVHGC
jgi:hypothetical protein